MFLETRCFSNDVVHDDLERINQDIEVIKKSKIKDTQSLVENMVQDKQA